MNATDPDFQHELRIKECYDRWLSGDHELWPELVALIKGRSLAQVAKMEKDKGLA